MPLDPENLGELRWPSNNLTTTLQADAVWTSLATAATAPDRPAPLSVREMDELVSWCTALRDSIETAIAAGERVASVLQSTIENDPVFTELPTSLQEALGPEGQPALDALEKADNSLTRLATQGFEGMREHRDEAVRLLMADLQGALCGAPVEGYLPTGFLCGLAMASMAAGLVTVWVPPHAHAAAAVGLGAAVYKSSKCGEKPATPR